MGSFFILYLISHFLLDYLIMLHFLNESFYAYKCSDTVLDKQILRFMIISCTIASTDHVSHIVVIEGSACVQSI